MWSIAMTVTVVCKAPPRRRRWSPCLVCITHTYRHTQTCIRTLLVMRWQMCGLNEHHSTQIVRSYSQTMRVVCSVDDYPNKRKSQVLNIPTQTRLSAMISRISCEVFDAPLPLYLASPPITTLAGHSSYRLRWSFSSSHIPFSLKETLSSSAYEM